MDNEIRIWSREGKELSHLKGHSKWITSICWQPLHRDERGSRKMVSGSKDGSAKVWDVVTGRLMFTLCGHSQCNFFFNFFFFLFFFFIFFIFIIFLFSFFYIFFL